MNTSFILRLGWDNQSRQWRIVIKPTDGGPSQVFADLEMAFLHVARNYIDHGWNNTGNVTPGDVTYGVCESPKGL